jgi:hypothetical protein
MPLMVIAPSVATMPRIERFVQEYDIKVAIHNHGPEDQYFPGPREALPVIGDMDPRVGLCVDVGHTTRTGVALSESRRSSIWRCRGSQSAHCWPACDRWQHPEVGRINPTRELPFRQIRPPTHQH